MKANINFVYCTISATINRLTKRFARVVCVCLSFTILNVFENKKGMFLKFYIVSFKIDCWDTLLSSQLFLSETVVFCSVIDIRELKQLLIGTLRSENGDVHENVAEKQTSPHFNLFRDYPSSPCCKRRGFWLELKRGERAQVRTEMVEFIALPIPFPSKLKIWAFHVVVV